MSDITRRAFAAGAVAALSGAAGCSSISNKRYQYEITETPEWIENVSTSYSRTKKDAGLKSTVRMFLYLDNQALSKLPASGYVESSSGSGVEYEHIEGWRLDPGDGAAGLGGSWEWFDAVQGEWLVMLIDSNGEIYQEGTLKMEKTGDCIDDDGDNVDCKTDKGWF